MRTKTGDWYEVKMRYDKVYEDGCERKVTESYVVEALSFGEAEKAAMEFLGSYVSGDIQIVNINPMKFKEVVFNEEESCDRYYKATLQFITLDEKTGKEKYTQVYYLVQASSFDNCKETIRSFMGSTMMDYQIVSVSETKIIDAIEHKL
ncbi:DUF4494 domain-containing protein [Prevotella melaninogenica]|jgi:hypothetical protein|uniref:DUF4494 domain-containing protein n=1 Tax=Prevotella melaninogenica TaxID=28132 RepID=UPI001BA96B17|nr:DUF4494 domain-containing protein [Prevotella melaninogenica]QUB65005.1 DUF4494 domain-containing protein [Prevotella melaninogenica]